MREAPGADTLRVGSRMAYILIVEDDSELSEVTAELLRLDGHEVAVAPNGLAGLHSMAKRPPNLVVVDLMMPMMSGIEMLDHLRRWTKLPKIPVVIVTAMPDLVRDQAHLLHHVVIRKPYAHGALTEAVKRLLLKK